jgi:hypothetical protein
MSQNYVAGSDIYVMANSTILQNAMFWQLDCPHVTVIKLVEI